MSVTHISHFQFFSHSQCVACLHFISQFRGGRHFTSHVTSDSRYSRITHTYDSDSTAYLYINFTNNNSSTWLNRHLHSKRHTHSHTAVAHTSVTGHPLFHVSLSIHSRSGIHGFDRSPHNQPHPDLTSPQTRFITTIMSASTRPTLQHFILTTQTPPTTTRNYHNNALVVPPLVRRSQRTRFNCRGDHVISIPQSTPNRRAHPTLE